MAFARRKIFSFNHLSLVVLSLNLSACLEGQGTYELDVQTQELELNGSVGDGPVVNGDMRLIDRNGSILLSFVSDAKAQYQVKIDVAIDQFPLRIDATGGTDLVTLRAPDFRLESTVVSPNQAGAVNLNPFSTLIVALAENLPGGLNSSNIAYAQKTISTELNSGLDIFATSGVIDTQVNNSNIAEIVKSSETLAELIRRTADRMNDSGSSISADGIVATMASDLTDGVMDGRGHSDADARVSAVATLMHAQVLMEAMVNELHVLDANAEAAMNAAIQRVANSPTKLVGDLKVTSDMIRKARVGLAAAYAITADPAIRDLHAAVSTVSAGSDPTIVRVLLPSDYRFRLDAVLASIATADSRTIELVNEIARGNGDLASGNAPPVISGSPPGLVRIGETYTFAPVANDRDGDTLTFSVANLPAWATVDVSTGAISGMPGNSDVGYYPGIVIRVTDGSLSDSLEPFAINVVEDAQPSPGNAPPVISGEPVNSVQTGQPYVFAPTAEDPDGDSLTFRAANLPSWAGFDRSTGTISGTPGDGDGGDYTGIFVTVTDGFLSDSLGPFTISVAENRPPQDNTPPVISGSPPDSVQAGAAFEFRPTASDPDGDTLTFSVANLPSWAGFDSSNGAINGTPAQGDVGNYAGIRLTVSDGIDSASIEFGISVDATSLGTYRLSWTPPTENTDGTPLTDLAGYRIFWGTTPGDYPNSVRIDNPGLTSYVIENLAPGTYEFVATAINADGRESPRSEPISGTVE